MTIDPTETTAPIVPFNTPVHVNVAAPPPPDSNPLLKWLAGLALTGFLAFLAMQYNITPVPLPTPPPAQPNVFIVTPDASAGAYRVESRVAPTPVPAK